MQAKLWTMTRSVAVALCLVSASSFAAEGLIENGFRPSSGNPTAVKISIIDQATALRLFKKLQAHPRINFKQVHGYCYARATAMVLMAEKENIYMGKIYAEGTLRAKVSDVDFQTWDWHTAPIALVQVGEKIEVQVFDPSLSHVPQTQEQWKHSISDRSHGYPAEAREIYFGTRFQYHPRMQIPKFVDDWYAPYLKLAEDDLIKAGEGGPGR